MKKNTILMLLLITIIGCVTKPEINNTTVNIDDLLPIEVITTDNFHINVYRYVDIASAQRTGKKLEKRLPTLLKQFELDSIEKVNVHIYSHRDLYDSIDFSDNEEVKMGAISYTTGKHNIYLSAMVNNSSALDYALVQIISENLAEGFHDKSLQWLDVSLGQYFSNVRSLIYIQEYDTIPSLAEFNDSENDHMDIYYFGYYICDYIVETHGKNKLFELIRNYGDVQKVLNMSVLEFEREYTEYITTTYLK